jgi:uncharacterized membrane protein YphA (DoxX/SURF4 family)
LVHAVATASEQKEQTMQHVHELAESASVVLAALFALAGLMQLVGLKPVRQAVVRWGYSPRRLRITGALELLAAILLAVPFTRPAGVVLAAAINFSIVVLLLNHRAWALAMPGVAMAAALLLTLFQWR